MRRAIWLARVAFHDWMWGGKSIAHRAAQALPLWFSDPYWVSNETFDRLFAEGKFASVTTDRNKVSVSVPDDWSVTYGPQTWATGTASTYHLAPKEPTA